MYTVLRDGVIAGIVISIVILLVLIIIVILTIVLIYKGQYYIVVSCTNTTVCVCPTSVQY